MLTSHIDDINTIEQFESIEDDSKHAINTESKITKNKTNYNKSNSLKNCLTPKLPKDKHIIAPNTKSHPSLAQRINNRLLMYKKSAPKKSTVEYEIKSTAKTRNNGIYSYPKYHTVLEFDQKYSRNNKDNFTKFVTTKTVKSKKINLMNTIGNNLIMTLFRPFTLYGKCI